MQGIKLNAQGVTGTLNGTKTNTRRPLKLPELKTADYIPLENIFKGFIIQKDGTCRASFEARNGKYVTQFIVDSKYKVGEVLYVQEELCNRFCEATEENKKMLIANGLQQTFNYNLGDGNKIYYLTSVDGTKFMKALQINLYEDTKKLNSKVLIKITGIKVEKLQDISEEDAIKEGCVSERTSLQSPHTGVVGRYANQVFLEDVWQPLPYPTQKKYQWSANPPVFAYEYEEST